MTKENNVSAPESQVSVKMNEDTATESEASEPENVDETTSSEDDVALPEVRFSVNTALNGALQQEATRSVRTKTAEILYFACLAALVLMLGVLVGQSISQGTNNFLYIALLTIALAYAVYTRVLGPKVSMRRWENDLVSRYKTSALHLTSDFYDLAMAQTVQETDSSVEAGYSEIRRVKETEHLFLLQSGRQQWFFVAKDGFTKGTADEFRVFIQDKTEGD